MLSRIWFQADTYPKRALISMFATSLKQLVAVAELTTSLSSVVDGVAEAIYQALESGGMILSCGNGGSAADAMHLAEELVGKFAKKRRALAGLCLNADPTALTCIANDFGFDEVFARGVEAFGKPGDVLVTFTTSGNSRNVLRAIETANQQGLTTVLVSGGSGGMAKGRCHHELIVPSTVTARIQEIHTLFLHSWLEFIDERYE